METIKLFAANKQKPKKVILNHVPFLPKDLQTSIKCIVTQTKVGYLNKMVGYGRNWEKNKKPKVPTQMVLQQVSFKAPGGKQLLCC